MCACVCCCVDFAVINPHKQVSNRHDTPTWDLQLFNSPKRAELQLISAQQGGPGSFAPDQPSQHMKASLWVLSYCAQGYLLGSALHILDVPVTHVSPPPPTHTHTTHMVAARP